MDESIKCECGNDKFWWIGEELLRCTACFNNYCYHPTYMEYSIQRFNKEENSYGEWEDFNPEGVVTIQDYEWRKFWLDRWLFEERFKRVKEFKEGLRNNITP